MNLYHVFVETFQEKVQKVASGNCVKYSGSWEVFGKYHSRNICALF